ncbi:MAG: TolC family protein [Gammaproteobacteria bacterium]|nr:TolC family protein [Gammaproteobacteria bacterium]
MRIPACILAFLACLTAPAAWGVDLNKVYGDALVEDPAMARARANLEAVRARVVQARAPMLPSLGFNYSKEWIDRSFPGSLTFDFDEMGGLVTGPADDESFDDKYWETRIGWSVFNAPNWFTLKTAKASSNRAEVEYAEAEQDLVRRVLHAYLDVLEAQDALQSVESEYASVSRQREQMQQRFDVGLAPITDVLETIAVEDSSYVRLLEASALHDAVFEMLVTLTGRNYEGLAPLLSDFEVVPPSPLDENTWVDAVLESNYAIRSAAETVNEAKSQLRVQQTARLPIVESSWRRSKAVTGGRSFFGDTIDNEVLGVTISLPIVQGGAMFGRTREARHVLVAAEETLRERRLHATRDARNHYRAVLTAVSRVYASNKAVASREAALRATQTGYEVGTRTSVDVLIVESQVLLERLRQAAAKYQYIKSLVDLKYLAGSLSSSDLVRLNDSLDRTRLVEPIQMDYEQLVSCPINKCDSE